ncbi:o-succinylbenzoate synthase [Candidatus Uabimicrobium amorphum]|uniref:o-succinylbenzoate synthase n=1 Tax=Uabimicrobium amorphum TaxID=2596890 RepID=A0A5S9IQQ0_UABAM|nr:o-succinylbenzoate synthase [Candidatus Uabimicrobium amorphum]BBM85886.1 o-succinylbenzoate synthase [Candidatus Uabimicrobium amorphum]
MRVNDIVIHPFDLPLTKPLQLKRDMVENRRGLVVELRGDDCRGYGEIAPLPYFHNETLQQIHNEIDIIKNSIYSLQWDAKAVVNTPGFFGEKLSVYNFAPSVMWGIETALWNLTSDYLKTPPRCLWKKDCRDIIEINGLLSGKPQDIKQQVDILKKQGVQTVKLKVGRNTLEEDLQNIAYVRQQGKWKMRLDANRSWSVAQAQDFLQRIEEHTIEYIEEPVATQQQPQLKSDIRVAWDESVYEQQLPPTKPPYPQAVVLKPALIGGIARTFQWISWAQKLRIPCVMSSCFETSIGLFMLANIAATTSPIANGLDTYKWLQSDVANPRFAVKDNHVDLSQFCNIVYQFEDNSRG